MSVVAKFYVTKKVLYASPEDTGEVFFAPVYKSGTDGNACTENHIFGKYTPSGELRMSIQNPAAFKQFRVGYAYLIHFEEAEKFQ